MDRNSSDGHSDFAVARGDLNPILNYCSERNLKRALREASVDAAIFASDSNIMIPLADYFRILKVLTVELQDETARLSSRNLMPGAAGYIVSGLSSCQTLYKAMKAIATSYNMMHGGAYNHVEHHDDHIVYVVDDRSFPYRTDDAQYIYFTLECVLIFLHCILESIASDELLGHLRKVYTKRESRHSASLHMDFWTVPVRYHSNTYALIYDAAAAELPVNVAADFSPTSQEIYDEVIRVVEAASSSDKRDDDIVRQVEKAIEMKIFRQADAARHLGCSVATLRRRLSERNSSFRAISKSMLNKSARQLLAQGFRTSEIAEQLGFSDSRSFARAFKTWNGMTPKQFTQRNTPESTS